ncbi:MAG: NAD-dependent deacetylase [Ulvibacter sp.]|jgi:NAD-dependent deacetylase
MKIAVLTGAGISAESGLKTFRDSNGLWEGHDVMEVASPEGFAKNPKLVLDFYNQRRQQLLQVNPNNAHISLAQLESDHDIKIVTQNVDDLHERAGSSSVLHLHGELLKVRSTYDEHIILDWPGNLNLGDLCSKNHQLRPHIVWFGEAVPLMEEAITIVEQAEAVIIVGTSLQVYPAAGLLQYAAYDAEIYLVDPKPALGSSDRIKVYSENASTGIQKVIDQINLNL